MPKFIMKADRDADLYVEWSTVVDNFTWSGTRSELIAYGRQEGWENVLERLTRTDEAGTSAMWGAQPFMGAWDDPSLLTTNDPVLSGFWLLDRFDLAAYVAGDHTVLQPLPDDGDGD